MSASSSSETPAPESVRPGDVQLLVAAKAADWGQVVRNGGPPCFWYEREYGKFCLRAELWPGHDADYWCDHPFVSFENLLKSLLVGRGTPHEADQPMEAKP